MGSELECLRFLGRPGPRRAGLREFSSLLRGSQRVMLETSKHFPQAYWRALPRRGILGATVLSERVYGKVQLGPCSSEPA